MKLKGISKLREKLPDYPGSKVFRIPLIALLAYIFGMIFLFSMDLFPRFFSAHDFFLTIEPFTPIIGTFILVLTGFLLVYKVWYSRENYEEKYEERAYQKALKLGLVGIPFIIASVIHSYIPIGSPIFLYPRNNLTEFFSASLLSLIPILVPIEFIIRTIISMVFVILALLTMIRSLLTFGIDYMAVVYLYYPEESEVQDLEIYSILRHPAYTAIMFLCIGGILARLSLYSLIFSSMVMVGLMIHIRFVEEKELVERFGESYNEYRSEVPALLVKPRNLGKFFKFLVKQEH